MEGGEVNFLSEQPWVVLLISFVLLQIGDGLATYILGRVTSKYALIEWNSIARKAMLRDGFIYTIVKGKIISIAWGCGLFIGICYVQSNWPLKATLIIITTITAVVNVYSWILVGIITLNRFLAAQH